MLREVSGMVPEWEVLVDVDGWEMNVRTFTMRHVALSCMRVCMSKKV